MFGSKKKKKSSFFEKLTGSVDIDRDFDDDFDDEEEFIEEEHKGRHIKPRHVDIDEVEEEEEIEEVIEESNEEGQLSVDVLETPDEIVVKTMVAGVKPGDLDIDITRDIITIRGTREEDVEVDDDNYYHRELYWGTFSREIMLPSEVDVEESSAIEKHGLLIIRMPKLDKNRKTKLQVKSK